MQFAIKPISAAVLIAWGVIMPSLAGAQTVSNQSVTGSYSVSGTNYSNTGAVVSSSTPYMFQSQGFGYAALPGALVYGNATTGQISSGAQAGGDTSGNLPRPNIPFSNATSSIAYHATYTNNSAAAQSYDFHFLIDRGVLALSNLFGNIPASASVLGSVKINNSEVFSTQATLSGGGYNSQGVNQPSVFTQSGANIGYTNDMSSRSPILGNLYIDAMYRFGGAEVSISLGSFNPGQSVDIDYMLQNTAATDGFGYYGGAISLINDPFGVQRGNIAGIPSVSVSAAPEVSTVPEPESISLMVAGLGLLAVRGRRRKVR